jgi:hypothetical protein
VRSPTRILALVFGLIGIVLLLAGLGCGIATLVARQGAVHTEGQVIDQVRSGSSRRNRGGYLIVVRYADAHGNRYEVSSRIGSNPPAAATGESVGIYYPPEHPEDGRIDLFLENWFLACLFGGLGSVFGAIGGGFALSLWRERRLHEWLEQNGARVEARVTGVERNTRIRINGRSPWRITAEWQHPVRGSSHVFRSENLWTDPSDQVRDLKTVRVRIDADDPRRHWMDVGFLRRS